MVDNIVLIFKGFIIGVGKIVPGVSGSVLAILLNVYEQGVDAISNIFKNLKKNITFLGLLGVGILISIILGSKVLLYVLSNYYFSTFSLIIGLILGTMPSILKDIKISSKVDLFYLVIPFLILYLLSNLKFDYYLGGNVFVYFLIGLMEAFTTIIPGVSSTALYMSFGIYNLFLNIFSNIFSFKFLMFSVGLFMGIFLTSKLVNYLFKNHKKKTYLVILSILISSIFVLIKDIFSLYDFHFLKFLIFLGIGFVISKLLDK